MKIHILFKVTLLFIFLILLYFLIALGIKNTINIDSKYNLELVLVSIDLSFLIIIFIAIKMWKIDVPKLFKKVPLKHILYLIAIGILITLIYPIANIPNLLNSFATNKTGVMVPITDVFNQKGIGVYFVIRTLLIMPFLEEILYRGIIQNKLSEKIPTVWAIVLTSLFFAVGHLDFEQSITVFFSSLIIGYIYHKNKNLTTVVLIHSFINLGFLFLKIEYQDSINYSILLYHFILIALLLFITKKYAKKHSYGN